MAMGRRVHVTIGRARDSNKIKVKVILDDPRSGAMDDLAAFAVRSIIHTVREWVTSNVAVDRGHKHSSGKSEVGIWIAGLGEAASSTGPAAASFVDVSGMVAATSTVRAPVVTHMVNAAGSVVVGGAAEAAKATGATAATRWQSQGRWSACHELQATRAPIGPQVVDVAGSFDAGGATHVDSPIVTPIPRAPPPTAQMLREAAEVTEANLAWASVAPPPRSVSAILAELEAKAADMDKEPPRPRPPPPGHVGPWSLLNPPLPPPHPPPGARS